jgi:hypothetical protein
MLVSRRNTYLHLVTQPDHARLAGKLAALWGNDQFALCALQDALVHTATFHDDGWIPLDRAPTWNAEQRRPAHFLEIPLPVVAEAYTKGVDVIYAASPVAGVLESLHFTGFYRSRWGSDDSPHVDHPAVPAIVEAEEDRRARAIRETWPHERPRGDFERELWHAYEILQVLDLLSLCICLVDLNRESPEHTVQMSRTLFSIDQEPSRRLILRAPISNHGQRADLIASVVAPCVVELEPFPFSESEIALEVPSRMLEDKPYASSEETADAYHTAPVEPLVCSLRAAS